jgi:transposase
MLKFNVIGLDLAKNVIQVCKISADGELIYNKAVSPRKLRELLAKEKIAIIALEGCGSCHYWGRLAQQYGHDVRIISPKKVKAFLQGQKTDANDALAIAVASIQVGMVFSQLKSEEQQTLQTVEKSRKFLEKSVTSLSNHIRAFMYEYGITSPQGKKGLRETVSIVMDEDDKRLPDCLQTILTILWARYKKTLEQLKASEQTREALVKQLEPCKRLLDLEGVGPVCAARLYASLGNGRNFKKGRDASVYVGLTPKQHSSGGNVYMRGINKGGGDKELRAALYQGAFSVIYKLPAQARTKKQAWLISLVKRVGVKRASIALANKTVRTAWALLVSGEKYKAALI